MGTGDNAIDRRMTGVANVAAQFVFRRVRPTVWGQGHTRDQACRNGGGDRGGNGVRWSGHRRGRQGRAAHLSGDLKASKQKH